MRSEVRSALVLGALAGLNVLVQRSRLNPDVLVPAGAAALLAGARASGLSSVELGLSRRQSARALPGAAVAAAVTAGAVAAAASLPVASGFRDDSRYADPAAAVRSAFLTIPLSVAVPEELLFRSVLDALLRRHLGDVGTTVVQAAAFGLWHALGAASLSHDNAGVAKAVGSVADGRGRTVTTVAGVVLATALAGLGFAVLRRRTDSVLPGIAVHWALNAAAALAGGIPRRRRASRATTWYLPACGTAAGRSCAAQSVSGQSMSAGRSYFG